MKNILLAVFLFSCFSFSLLGQNAEKEVMKSLFDEMTNVTMHEGIPYYKFNTKKPTIEGSQFLGEDWEEGIVITPKDEKYRIKGRYDAYSDEVQVLVDEQVKSLFPDKIRAVALGEQIMVPHAYVKGKNDMRLGFFELLVEGDVSLLLRHEAEVQQGGTIHPVLGREGGKSKIVIEENYYYSSKKRPAVKLRTSKGGILEALNKRRKAVAQYAKKNDIGTKNQEDIVTLFKFYNDQL